MRENFGTYAGQDCVTYEEKDMTKEADYDIISIIFEENSQFKRKKLYGGGLAEKVTIIFRRDAKARHTTA